VPLFRSFRNCFSALHSFAEYQLAAKHFRPRRAKRSRLDPELSAEIDRTDGQTTDGQTADGPTVAGTDLARRLLDWAGVPLAGDTVATSVAAAVRAADSFGYPVVMKLASPDVAHKSDAGLVLLDIGSPAEVRSVYRDLMKRAEAMKPMPRIEGIQIQQQLIGGTEMIVGLSTDPVFGQVLLVGTGGVFAEVLRDVAVRPLPVDRRDVEEMVASLRGAALLAGARGRPKGDVKALVDLALSVASLANACGDRLVELDLNPVVVREKGEGAVAVDSLLVLQGAGG
jgi:acyl-CoA synthetase (NDP forming)